MLGVLKSRKVELEELMQEGLKTHEINAYDSGKLLNFSTFLLKMAEYKNGARSLTLLNALKAEFSNYGEQLAFLSWLKAELAQL